MVLSRSLQKRSQKETLNLLKKEQSFRRKAELLILTVALLFRKRKKWNLKSTRLTYKLTPTVPEEPADIRIFNQAMMELGATVCGPNTAPRCDDCPVSGLCLGRQRGTAETLPVKKAKKERRVEEKTVLLLKRDGKIALRKRPKTGLLAGLWEFPNVEGALDETAAGAAVEAMGLSVIDWQSRLTAKHIFTHVEWRMTGYALTVRGDGPAELEWVDAAGLAARSVPSAFARYYEEAKRELEMK